MEQECECKIFVEDFNILLNFFMKNYYLFIGTKEINIISKENFDKYIESSNILQMTLENCIFKSKECIEKIKNCINKHSEFSDIEIKSKKLEDFKNRIKSHLNELKKKVQEKIETSKLILDNEDIKKENGINFQVKNNMNENQNDKEILENKEENIGIIEENIITKKSLDNLKIKELEKLNQMHDNLLNIKKLMDKNKIESIDSDKEDENKIEESWEVIDKVSEKLKRAVKVEQRKKKITYQVFGFGIGC